MADRNSSKIIPYRRPFRINISLIVLIVIFIYVMISVFTYLTSHKTEVYEVRTGSLTENRVYQGIALRREVVVRSDYTGTLHYYNKEGDRVAVGSLVYSVDESEGMKDFLVSEEEAAFSQEDLLAFRSDAIAFMKDFTPDNFSQVYDFKSSTVSAVQKISNRKALRQLQEKETNKLHTCKADLAGEVIYAIDNCEDITFENLTADCFDLTGYNKRQLENGSSIVAGDPACKVVTDENWSIAIQVPTAEEAQALVDKGYMQVKFLDKQLISWASVSSRSDEDGNYFINLRFTNSMSTFCTERYLDIELITEERSGLKVPNSSITKGSFFIVPKEFVFEGTGGQRGVLQEIYTENRERSTQFVPAVPYSEDDEHYYLDDSVLRAGMIIDRPNSSEQFTLNDQAELIGVYYINKGYPDFRNVTILYQNEEYAIVEPNTLYGLQEYDYIVLRADSVSLNNY